MSIENVIRYLRSPFDSTSCGQDVDRFFYKHPHVHEVALLVNHVVRATMTGAMMVLMPYAPATKLAVGLGLSLFYWITVERGNCTLRFALPAYAGAVAYQMSKPALPALINGAAFRSIAALTVTLISAWPCCLYALVITAIVHEDVRCWNSRHGG